MDGDTILRIGPVRPLRSGNHEALKESLRDGIAIQIGVADVKAVIPILNISLRSRCP